MRQHKARPRFWWRLQQAGDALGIIHGDRDGLWLGRIHLM
jgi:hypothetical protein